MATAGYGPTAVQEAHYSVYADPSNLLNPQPTVFENHVVSMDVDGVPLELALWDTAGTAPLRLRSLLAMACSFTPDPGPNSVCYTLQARRTSPNCAHSPTPTPTSSFSASQSVQLLARRSPHAPLRPRDLVLTGPPSLRRLTTPPRSKTLRPSGSRRSLSCVRG